MKFEKRTFQNGLRAIVAPMKDTQAVTLWVLFGTGSKYETKRLNGISHFVELLYGDTPAGRYTTGYPETVKNIKREDILHYRNSHYLTSNAVVVVEGNIDSSEAFRKVEKVFSKMPHGKKLEKNKVREHQRIPAVRFKKKDVDQPHLRLGVRAYDMYDERRYALNVLNTVIGGDRFSR